MGDIVLLDGNRGNVVLVGPRDNPKGASLVLPGEEGGKVRAVPLMEGVGLLHPQVVVDIICTQERVFGELGLDSPFDTAESSQT